MKEKVRTLERQLVVHEQLQSQFAALQVENEVNITVVDPSIMAISCLAIDIVTSTVHQC